MTQPENQSVMAGQTATFTVTASGTAPLNYQWQRGGATIAGATAASYTTAPTSASDDGAQFSVVISNTAGSATSNVAALTVTAAPVAPTITTQPASQTVTAGQAATFTVVATGTAPLMYQWSGNGTAIAGATAASYTTAPTSASDNGAQFTVVVSNTAGSATSNAATLTVTAGAPRTLHYGPNGNFDSNGNYLPGADGFNLADVSDVGTLNSLPTGVLGLVWLGLCNGADATFTASVQPFIGNPKLFGFYLMDEPDPTGQNSPSCPPAKLMAESDWIHANVPGAKTFIVMLNLGTNPNPSYANTYNPANTDIDLFGLDPYPVMPEFPGGVDYDVIGLSISAAEAEGIPANTIVPVFQAFGDGVTWTLPTPAQEQQILSIWDALIPNPVFDMAYSWGVQQGDQALSTTPDLQPIFLQHNTGH